MTEKDDLEQFEKSFPELLDEMATRVDPRESRRTTREGLGKLIDLAILLRQGFGQAWQFIIVIQALFIFLGLAPQVSQSLNQLGISISGTMIGIIALGAILFFVVFGMALLLYGGTQRSTALITQKQSPSSRMNYQFYRAMSRWAKRMDERLDRIESKIEELEETV